MGGWGDVLGLWDGNPVKLDCDDHYTTTDVINSLSNKKKSSSAAQLNGCFGDFCVCGVFFVCFFFVFLFFVFFCFLRLHPWYMEVPRLGVESELQLLAYSTATAMRGSESRL